MPKCLTLNGLRAKVLNSHWLRAKPLPFTTVVISSKLATDAFKTPVSRNVGNLVRNAADGWEATLENPEAREVKVHCDEILSCCPDPVSAEQQCKFHPGAIAVEMQGKGEVRLCVKFRKGLNWDYKVNTRSCQ